MILAAIIVALMMMGAIAIGWVGIWLVVMALNHGGWYWVGASTTMFVVCFSAALMLVLNAVNKP